MRWLAKQKVHAPEKGRGIFVLGFLGKGAISFLSPQDFPGGSVAKTPCSQCRGPGFNPWSGI